MDWSAPVDLYCERLGPGLWAEPLNAVSNAAFLLAALILWPRVRGLVGGQVLAAVLFVIGLGSLTFHTFATGWAGLADDLPIGVFILSYLYLVNRHFVGLPIWGAILATALFGPYAWLLVPLLDRVPFIGISNFYWTVPILLIGYAIALWRRQPQAARGLGVGATIITVSICVRSLDMMLCSRWPLGTHFLWHCLNAVMLGWMIEVYRRQRAGAVSGGPSATR